MRAIKIIAFILIILVVGVLGLIYGLPSKTHMERKVVINAPAYKVYQELITYRNFKKWSPWAVKDPAATYTYSGPEFGPGAMFSWSSETPDLGNGSMEILLTEKDKRVVWEMRFDGYESDPTASFLLNSISEKETEVIWTYDEEGVEGFSKIFMLGIDGFLGGDYEKGLELLKARVEGLPNFSMRIEPGRVNGYYYLGLEDSTLNEPSLLETKMAINFGELESYMNQNDIEPKGKPLSMITKSGNFNVKFVCGIPVAQQDTIFSDRIQMSYQDSTLVLVGHYYGSYAGIPNAYEEVEKFASYYNYSITGGGWESYITDPESQGDTSQWLTEIYYPVR